MKKTILKKAGTVFLFAVMAGCGTHDEGKNNMDTDLKKKAQERLEKQNPEKESTPSNGPAGAMSVAEAKKYLSAADANKGKLITINVYPKGITKPQKGEFMLYVSDKTGSGLTDENFACIFKEDMTGQVRNHKADQLVKISGSINWNNGMVVLKNAAFAE